MKGLDHGLVQEVRNAQQEHSVCSHAFTHGSTARDAAYDG